MQIDSACKGNRQEGKGKMDGLKPAILLFSVFWETLC
jgi:hypothetical protein